jgi:hypothetical protein
MGSPNDRDGDGGAETGSGIEVTDPSYWVLLRELVCSFRQFLGVAIAFAAALLTLSLFSLLYLDPGDTGYVVASIDAVVLSLFLVVAVFVFARCQP